MEGKGGNEGVRGSSHDVAVYASPGIKYILPLPEHAYESRLFPVAMATVRDSDEQLYLSQPFKPNT